ncbi:hypothetical protein ACHAPA_012328, partial [Fusarium lateritium]
LTILLTYSDQLFSSRALHPFPQWNILLPLNQPFPSSDQPPPQFQVNTEGIQHPCEEISSASSGDLTNSPGTSLMMMHPPIGPRTSERSSQTITAAQDKEISKTGLIILLVVKHKFEKANKFNSAAGQRALRVSKRIGQKLKKHKG